MLENKGIIAKLRTTLGYPEDHIPVSLAILVQEVCEEYIEKTAMLVRVNEYLDKLETMQQQRKRDTENAIKAMQDALLRGKEALSHDELEPM